MIRIGKYHLGVYCGAKPYRLRDWKIYGLFRKLDNAFSIGPILFWIREEWVKTWKKQMEVIDG